MGQSSYFKCIFYWDVEASASSLFFSLLVWEDYRYTIQPYHDVLTQYNSKEIFDLTLYPPKYNKRSYVCFYMKLISGNFINGSLIVLKYSFKFPNILFYSEIGALFRHLQRGLLLKLMGTNRDPQPDILQSKRPWNKHL